MLRGRLQQTAPRDTARDSEGREVFPAGEGHRPVKQLRGLLEGLGIDPDALEVRVGIRRPGEQGRPHGSGAADSGATDAGEGKLTSGLLEALTLLCQAGERFMNSAGEGRRRMIEAADPTAAPEENTRGERGRPGTRGVGYASRRDGSRAARREPAVRGEEDSADENGGRRRALESSEYARGNQGSLERCGGLQRVVVLMPDGGQLINMGIGRGFVFSVDGRTVRSGAEQTPNAHPVGRTV